MKEFIAYLVKNLVEHPHDVEVTEADEDSGMTITVKVADGDVAKVVGREGRTIKALRTLAMTLGARFDRRVRIDLVE